MAVVRYLFERRYALGLLHVRIVYGIAPYARTGVHVGCDRTFGLEFEIEVAQRHLVVEFKLSPFATATIEPAS